MASIGDVVAQLNAVIADADRGAIAAARAEVDARAAHEKFAHVAQGSNDPALRRAVAESQIAADKLAKLVRHLSAAADAFTAYVNTIAPGSAPARPSATAPTGDYIVKDAERRTSKADAAWRTHVRKADDIADSLKKTESTATSAFKYATRKFDPPSTASTKAMPGMPQVRPLESPQIENPITAMVMATAALAVAVKGSLKYIRKREERSGRDVDKA